MSETEEGAGGGLVREIYSDESYLYSIPNIIRVSKLGTTSWVEPGFAE